MLRDGDVDELVRVEERLEHRPDAQRVALQIDLLEEARLGQHHLGARGLRGGRNAAALEARLRVVAGDVGDDDGSRPRREALPHDLGHHIRVRRRGLLGRTVPRDVGLDDDGFASGDEAAHAAHLGERALHQGLRRLALRDHHLRQRRVGSDGVITPAGDRRVLLGPRAPAGEQRAQADGGRTRTAKLQHADEESSPGFVIGRQGHRALRTSKAALS